MSTAPTARPPATNPANPANPARPVPLPPLHGPWPSASLWGPSWPGAGRPAGPITLLAVGLAAAVAALSLPLDRPGLGWLITAVAAVAALIVARAVPGRRPAGLPAPLVVEQPAGPGWDRYCWAAATVALLAVGTFRSAGWLFLLCLAVATLTGTLALAGGRSMRAIAAGYLMGPVAAMRAFPWVVRGLTRVRRPGGGAPIRIVATVVVSIALLTVFGALFASADTAFADVLAAVIPTVDGGSVARWIFVLCVATPVLAGTAYLRIAPPDLSNLDHTEGRKVNRIEWAVPLGLLVLLFAGFVAVQLTVLFGGNRHVLQTDGLTYADYARGGFWQLSFVTALTLVVLAGAARWAPRTTSFDRVLLRSILGTLAALTLVVVASALLRIHVYTDTYGLTRLRLLVACCEGWFGLVLIMVLVAGVRIRAPWLPRAAIAAGVLALLGLAAANPDALIAGHNLRQSRTVDADYLDTLSPDAVPAVAEYATGNTKACVLAELRQQLTGHDDWRQWNLGRQRAREITKIAPPC